ncbi:MAG TPA: DUF5615 family PIN-like protein [Chloroflexota bacterium]|nr:DUF5615 family PIN-like protein [Chloroflexota bacterium]
MRFLLDESADVRVGNYRASQGHDVTSIVRDHPRAISDERVLALAYSERRVVITEDRDFGDLVVRHGQPHAGVILFRLPATDLDGRIARLDEIIARYPDRLDCLLVVRARGIRVRITRPA